MLVEGMPAACRFTRSDRQGIGLIFFEWYAGNSNPRGNAVNLVGAAAPDKPRRTGGELPGLPGWPPPGRGASRSCETRGSGTRPRADNLLSRSVKYDKGPR